MRDTIIANGMPCSTSLGWIDTGPQCRWSTYVFAQDVIPINRPLMVPLPLLMQPMATPDAHNSCPSKCKRVPLLRFLYSTITNVSHSYLQNIRHEQTHSTRWTRSSTLQLSVSVGWVDSHAHCHLNAALQDPVGGGHYFRSVAVIVERAPGRRQQRLAGTRH